MARAWLGSLEGVNTREESIGECCNAFEIRWGEVGET